MVGVFGDQVVSGGRQPVHYLMLCCGCQVLEFETKKEMTLEMWTDRNDKIEKFFGPGVKANIEKTEQARLA